MIVSDVTERARKVFLNDTDVQLYTDEVLFPFVQQAYGEAEKELNLNGISTTEEWSTVISVAAGVEPVIGLNEINDLVLPLELSERAVGETYYTDMYKRPWLPDTERTEYLIYWDWRENEIKLLGSTAIREVRVKYIKGLPALVNSGSTVGINSAMEFLAAKASAYASRFIGGNASRADSLEIIAREMLPKMVAVEVKAEQSNPVRRKPYRAFRHITY